MRKRKKEVTYSTAEPKVNYVSVHTGTHNTPYRTHNTQHAPTTRTVEGGIFFTSLPLSPLPSLYLVVFDAHKFEGALVVARARLYFDVE